MKYWLYFVFSLGGIIILWKEYGTNVGLLVLFMWLAGFILGAEYRSRICQKLL